MQPAGSRNRAISLLLPVLNVLLPDVWRVADDRAKRGIATGSAPCGPGSFMSVIPVAVSKKSVRATRG